MTQSDCTPVNVELFPWDLQVPGGRDYLGGKVFVDLNQVDVVDRHARTVQSLVAGFNRPQTPDLGIERRNSTRNDAGKRVDAQFTCPLIARHNNSSSAIIQCAAVASGNLTVWSKDWL